MVITLGALIAEVSHTLPVPITGLASDEKLVEELDLQRSSYEGPTGIVGVVHDCCRQVGMTSASLWAAVPHYVAAVPNPKAALALLRRLEGLTGIAVDATDLEEEASSYEDQINRAIAANPEIEELVDRIETEQAEQLEGPEDLPSADTIARDFQQFLRQQGESKAPLRGWRGSRGPRRTPRARRRPPQVATGFRGRASSLTLCGRADQPVVAPAAGGGRGPRLEVLAEHALADLQHGALDPLGVVGPDRRGDLVGVEHVVVAAAARLEPPGLAGGEPVEGELQVVLQLRPRSCARRSCSRSARSCRREGGRRGRRGRAPGAGRCGCRTCARARPAPPSASRSRSQ